MKKQLMSLEYLTLLLFINVLCLNGFNFSYSQEIKWLRVTPLQSPINSIGAIFEAEMASQLNINFFTWPAQYGIGANDQNVMRAQGIWIGCKNFNDPVAGKKLNIKVIGSGPRNDPDRINQIFPVELKLIGKKTHPSVIVNDAKASLLDTYDQLDEIDPNMACDRMVIVKFNTSIGISVTEKVMSFTNSSDENYFIYDWVFKNTGIYNKQGDVKRQTLDSTYFYFSYRYAFEGEAYNAPSEPVPAGNWGAFNSAWGYSTFNHDFGDYGSWSEFNNSQSPLYQIRGFYSYYGPNKSRPVTYDEDWGCPAQSWDGRLGSWKYAGNIVIHADKSTNDNSDDIAQPTTTWFLGSDLDITQTVNQYDEILMARRYKFMKEGHPPLPHDLTLNGGYEADYTDAERNAGGGTSQGEGFGPYSIAPEDSVHIVYATAVTGISREKNLEVGANWLQYYNKTGTPDLVMPDGSQAPKTLDGANAYKKAWVQSGIDSIIQAYREAIDNYNSDYQLGKDQTPPPPDQFIVHSGGNRITLSWSDNADRYSHFNGYVIYRSEGSVMDPLSRYFKIFECNKLNIVHNFDDVTAKRGFDYYYYIQTKSDGSENKIRPGEPIYSSLCWTITDMPAHLERPAIPDTPLPFDIATTKWIPMTDRGAWTASVMYFYKPDSIYGADAVSYDGNTFVCIHDSLIGAAPPDKAGSVWKKATSKGAWASGTAYSAYDYVKYNNINYYTQFSISGGQGLDLVRVVPNPYDIRSRTYQFGTSLQQADRIAFYGLPGVCSLKIFTERGDLIWEKEHNSGTGDELWNSTTTYGQVVASGIYILYVATPNGQNVIRKFVIIR